MKKIYICAVFGLLFASCSTDDGQTEPLKYTNEVHAVTPTNWLSVMTSVESAVENQSSYTDLKEMIAHVESNALATAGFVAMLDASYKTPKAFEVKNVMHTDQAKLIGGLNYSATAKTYLNELIVDKKAWAVSPEANPLLSAKEVKLLQFVKDINDPDDEWNGRKPLAFAYGYQTSDATAIVYAVLAGEYKKVK